MKNLLIVLSLIMTTAALSATPSTDTSEAVIEAVKLFEKDHSQDEISDFKGIKASPNSQGVNVTIYLKSNPKVKYGCHRHSAGEPFECHHAH